MASVCPELLLPSRSPYPHPRACLASHAVHYPAAATTRTVAPRASIYQLTKATTGEAVIETLVGHVAAGGHLATSASAGSAYRVRDSLTRRVLLDRVEAGSEAEQHIDVTAAHKVTLEFALSPSTAAGDGAAIYWTWGAAGSFAREHLHAELRQGSGEQTLTVTSPPGETWLVRRASRPGEGTYKAEQMLLEVTAQDAPATQRHVIVVPPRAHA